MADTPAVIELVVYIDEESSRERRMRAEFNLAKEKGGRPSDRHALLDNVYSTKNLAPPLFEALDSKYASAITK